MTGLPLPGWPRWQTRRSWPRPTGIPLPRCCRCRRRSRCWAGVRGRRRAAGTCFTDVVASAGRPVAAGPQTPCRPGTRTGRDWSPSPRPHQLAHSLARHADRAFLAPEAETPKDVWDLAAFGLAGRLGFSPVRQPWLRETARRWAADNLSPPPRSLFSRRATPRQAPPTDRMREPASRRSRGSHRPYAVRSLPDQPRSSRLFLAAVRTPAPRGRGGAQPRPNARCLGGAVTQPSPQPFLRAPADRCP